MNLSGHGTSTAAPPYEEVSKGLTLGPVLNWISATQDNKLSTNFNPLIRHAGASLMDRNNAPIGAIQIILGHESRRTVEIYLRSIDNAEAEAIAIYEAARQKPHTTLTQKAGSETEKRVNQDG